MVAIIYTTAPKVKRNLSRIRLIFQELSGI
jgi:hypothetical protein